MDNMEMEQKVKDLAGDLGYQADRDLGAAGLDQLRRAGRVRKRCRVLAVACAAVVLVGAGILLPLILPFETRYHGQEVTLEFTVKMSSVAEFNKAYQTNYLTLSGNSEMEQTQLFVYEILETGEFAYLEEYSTAVTEFSYSYARLAIRLAEVTIPLIEEWKEECKQSLTIGQTAVIFSQEFSEGEGLFVSYANWVYDGVEYALQYSSLTEQDFFDELNRLLGQTVASA